jgi:hypothetical protein
MRRHSPSRENKSEEPRQARQVPSYQPYNTCRPAARREPGGQTSSRPGGLLLSLHSQTTPLGAESEFQRRQAPFGSSRGDSAARGEPGRSPARDATGHWIDTCNRPLTCSRAGHELYLVVCMQSARGACDGRVLQGSIGYSRQPPSQLDRGRRRFSIPASGLAFQLVGPTAQGLA